MIFDIMESCKQQYLLEEVEICLCVVMENFNIVIWDFNLLMGEMFYLYIFVVIFGFGEDEEVMYEQMCECIFLEDFEKILKLVMEKVMEMDVYEYEVCIVFFDGVVCWIFVCGCLIKDLMGKLVCMMGIIVDVIDEKIVCDKIEVFSFIVQYFDDVIIFKMFDGVIISWNNVVMQIFGYIEEEMFGNLIYVIILEDCWYEEMVIIEIFKCGDKLDYFEM